MPRTPTDRRAFWTSWRERSELNERWRVSSGHRGASAASRTSAGVNKPQLHTVGTEQALSARKLEATNMSKKGDRKQRTGKDEQPGLNEFE